MKRPNEIIVIVGPTASGKSDYAIRLAHEIGGEIVSADSRQVYRGMDIGSGKVPRDSPLTTYHSQPTLTIPSNQQRRSGSEKLSAVGCKLYVSGGIQHHLLDVASPKRTYTVTHFLRDAKAAITDIRKRGKVPIICGGTNFWIEALVFGTKFPEVKPDQGLRKRLGKLDTKNLFSMLAESDPERAGTIDRYNKVRLIRALEIIATLGKVPRDEIRDQESGIRQSGFKRFRFIGIDISREQLRENIEIRLKKRIEKGMIEEVKRLHEQEGLSWKRLESFGLEYRWVARYLQDKVTEEEMREKLETDIAHYAKRQMTSLRRLERFGIDIVWKTPENIREEENLSMSSG